MSLRDVFKSKSFWRGVTHFLCPHYSRKKIAKNGWAKDKAALVSDWKVIGNDLRGVITNYVR